MYNIGMKILKFLSIAIAPAALMGYGWYLGQLHKSGYDIAGIFLFITGATGLVLAIIFSILFRNRPWLKKWYVKGVIGLAGTAIVFVLLLVLIRLHA